MRRLLVNDCLTCIPGTRTFWHDLQDWFKLEFVGGDYGTLAETASGKATDATLIIRNATWFPPIEAKVPTISLLQDIMLVGPGRTMQEAVAKSSRAVVFNSRFTAAQYGAASEAPLIIPLPVDFSLFEPQNAMGCQQEFSLPGGGVCWVGASQGAAGHVKGWDIFLHVVRANPDIPFVAVFKDAAPGSVPPNLRYYVRLPQAELVKVIGACQVGLCTSRMESQHLAGIEMGACGLPLVVPPVGVYWNIQGRFPGEIISESTPSPLTLIEKFSAAIRSQLNKVGDREFWKHTFQPSTVRAAWAKLIEEVECSGRS